ncbi:LysR family transcriptional regulator [Aciduricibacillus chroicocephali]|uniref:LysR family transcriptional regulator n=1 Tax=Aciduricibacillus chroicocephali TaxID=3054939 RepID=A0ABY9KTQ5_9BACI|nr:LysR family transcriptional regulator [Bacillaceae bacterium 44XB]
MNLLKLKVLCLLVEHKKLAPVAEALGLTAPTVSFHLRSIEEEYNIRLFRTNPGGYRLTDAGEAFYHYAQQMVQIQKDLERFIMNLHSGNTGSIKLGASGLPAHIFMPDLINAMTEAYPEIKISLEVKTAPEIEKKLALQELDFGIIMETQQESPTLAYETIGEDMLVLAHSPEHDLATKKDISLTDLLETKLLLHAPSSSTNRFISKWFGESFSSSLQKIELDSVSTIKKMLFNGKTAAFLSNAFIEKEILSGELVQRKIEDVQLKRKIQLVYPKSRLDSALDTFIKETVRELALKR